MVTVRFEPLYGQDHVFLPDLDTEFGLPNAINQHPDNEYVQERELSDADAAIALSNPNFVDAATGKNPNFTCDECGAFHTHTVLTTVSMNGKNAKGVEVSPLCIPCEAKANEAAAAPTSATSTPASVEPTARPGDAVHDAIPIATPPVDETGSAAEVN